MGEALVSSSTPHRKSLSVIGFVSNTPESVAIRDQISRVRVRVEHQESDFATFVGNDSCVYTFGGSGLFDFNADMNKQFILMMGLPAAGKSTFIKQGGLVRLYGNVAQGFTSTGSDRQLVEAQYQQALKHHRYLSRREVTEGVLDAFKRATAYVDNYKNRQVHPVTLEWWRAHGSKPGGYFYKEFRAPYYSNRLDLRDVAKVADDDIWATKVVKSGRMLVVDTTGADTKKFIMRIEDAKKNGFTTSVLYLERDVELCLAGDDFRYSQHEERRGLGPDVIRGYAKTMTQNYHYYEQYGNKPNSALDRLSHFKWVPTGSNGVTQGKWVGVEDKRFSVQWDIQNKVARSIAR